MSKIYITGDTHGEIDSSKLSPYAFPPKGVELTKDDYLIVCGDFGVLWYGDEQDDKLIEWYNEKPWTTLFVDGNHENFDLLYKYPVVDFHGGKAHKVSNSVYHLMRGEIFNIDGKTFFTFGGAESHDKEYRREGISWWPQEMPTSEEYDYALENLKKHNNKVDYIITHEGPCDLIRRFYIYRHNDISNFLQYLDEIVDYKYWYFGHHHKDGIFGNKIYMYYAVLPLREGD